MAHVHAFVAALVGACEEEEEEQHGGEWARGHASGLRASLARLLARRATATGHLKRYAAAASDYTAAVRGASVARGVQGAISQSPNALADGSTLWAQAALQRDAGNTPLAAQLEADGGIMRQLEGQLAPCEPLETRFGDADLDATS